jgi:hypothetical protein
MTEIGEMLPESARVRRALWAAAVLCGVLAIGACDSTEGLLSSIGATDTPTSTSPNPAPPMGTASLAQSVSVAPIASGPPPAGVDTGTPVGKKVGNIRGDLQRLADNINQHNAEWQRLRAMLSAGGGSFRAMTTGIEARLRASPAPNDPQLVAQLGQAEGALERLNGTVAELGVLTSQVASDAALAAYVTQEIKAASYLGGAVQEDRRQLNALQALADSDTTMTDRLAQSVSGDYARESNNMANARRGLATLNLAIKSGSPASHPRALAATPAPAMQAAAPTGERKPLATIRFGNRRDVVYEQALYKALNRVLQRRPDAHFDLVAVSPSSGDAAQVSRYADAAKRNARNVMHALSRMGLPAARLTLSATTSTQVRGSEVQIFVH